MTKPTLFIDGVEYEERKPAKEPFVICDQCAFGRNPDRCAQAIDRSADAFGGDCVTNDVIYAIYPSKETAQ
jgi:hypothetical protein